MGKRWVKPHDHAGLYIVICYIDTRRKDKEGNVIKLPRTGDHGIYEFVDPNVPNHSFPRKHLGGGGEPLLTKSGELQTKRPGLLTTIHGARRTGIYALL